MTHSLRLPPGRFSRSDARGRVLNDTYPPWVKISEAHARHFILPISHIPTFLLTSLDDPWRHTTVGSQEHMKDEPGNHVPGY